MYSARFAEINVIVEREWFIVSCNDALDAESHKLYCGRAYTQIQCDNTPFYKIIIYNNQKDTERTNLGWLEKLSNR